MDANQLQQTETITWINPASSIEFQASINSKELHQIESITGMKPEDYNAAAEGEIQYFKDAHYRLDLLLTPNRNTILHIYITSLRNTEPKSKTQFVKEILNLCPQLVLQHNAKGETSKTQFVQEILNMCPQLVRQRNAKGETPLHIAARYGHAAIVKVLIEHANALSTDLESQGEVEQILGMTNQEKDTALHEAVRYNHLEVVSFLLEQDPRFSYSANKAGETLLYLAVERVFKGVTFEILDTCTSPPAYTGPLGRTALHAAVFWDDEGIIKRILQKMGIPTPLADEKGWTPLHLAAYFNFWKVVTPLLEDYRQMAYMKDKEGRTALHLATYKGNHMVVKKIISSCPDCCELVDKKGWNALHFSMESKSLSRIFLDNPSFANLLNEKDDNGNTALHHHFKSWSPPIVRFSYHPTVDKLAFNNQNHNILDLVSHDRGLYLMKWGAMHSLKRSNLGLRRSGRELAGRDCIVKSEEDKGTGSSSSMWEKSYEVHPVVATLIATVSFAAGITLPGGFVGQDDPDPGSAVLARSAAFKAFVVSNTLALLLSTWAVFAHTIRSLPFFLRPALERYSKFYAWSAYRATIVALAAMSVAFVTGTYAVLAHHYSDIAIATWTVGPFLLVIIFVVDYLLIMKRKN